MGPHPELSDRQREVLRARCAEGSRKAAAKSLGMSVWRIGWVLRSLPCGCEDDAQACWEHRLELETVRSA